MATRLLVIDDDPALHSLLDTHLTPLGYLLDRADDGEQGLEKALANQYELVIADLVMPGKHGLEVCRELRYSSRDLPLLVLSAQEHVMDRILSLELGADDFLLKPFHVRELTARIDALLRRSRRNQQAQQVNVDRIQIGDITVDRIRKKVFRGSAVILLSATEYRLLETLAMSPGKVFTRDELREVVWGYTATSFDHTITTTLSRVRIKLEPNPRTPRYLLSERGRGYRFVEAAELNTPTEGTAGGCSVA